MESELYNKAMVFFNDAKLTEKWLNHPCPSLGHCTPLQLYNTESGKQKVLDYLDICTGVKSSR